jgi:hypothetical protein
MKSALALLLLTVATAWAGIGADLNTAIKGRENVHFDRVNDRVMMVTCNGQTMFESWYFMDGKVEGFAISRIDRLGLNTKQLNQIAQTYAPAHEWKPNGRKDGVTYWYCARLGLWSHYDRVSFKGGPRGGWPTYFIYTDKLAVNMTESERAAATYSPDSTL